MVKGAYTLFSISVQDFFWFNIHLLQRFANDGLVGKHSRNMIG
jgi:hypothetical protein